MFEHDESLCADLLPIANNAEVHLVRVYIKILKQVCENAKI